MSRRKKVIRNFIILVILFLLMILIMGYYLSPMKAFEHSEMNNLYGPSKVIYIEKYDKGKYILSKYEKWVSFNTLKKHLIFLWGNGNMSSTFENDKTKAVSYTWCGRYNDFILFGSINVDKIIKIELSNDKGEILTQTEFHEGLFLFDWKADKNEEKSYKYIKAYDIQNNVIFEDQFSY